MDMRVSEVFRAYEVSKANPAPRTERISRAEEKKDMLALSNNARDYQNVRKALKGVPDIRNDKVELLKGKIDSNTYDVSAKDVAGKIMSNIK